MRSVDELETIHRHARIDEWLLWRARQNPEALQRWLDRPWTGPGKKPRKPPRHRTPRYTESGAADTPRKRR